MARIRSIKPQFWSDVKIANLKNKLAGYFFIGLWNFADDEGKFPYDSKALSLHMPIFRSKEIVTYLSELSQQGLIRKSACSQWGVITNWNHQKINRPVVPKVKKEEIQWLDILDSSITREPSMSPHCKDRIGKDRIGKDRINKSSTQVHDSSKELNRKIWDAYKTGYQKRYKVEPVRNASVNAKISQLAKRLGADAVGVILFYTEHNNQFYSRHMHAIGLCLKDAEALHTQWKTGVVAPTAVSMFAPKKIDWDEFAKELKSKDQQ